jgi:hypothetical protein
MACTFVHIKLGYTHSHVNMFVIGFIVEIHVRRYEIIVNYFLVISGSIILYIFPQIHPFLISAMNSGVFIYGNVKLHLCSIN